MKKVNARLFTKRFATLGIMGLMAVCALLPATTFAATTQTTKCAADDVKCVITAGDLLITNRQNSLNTLKTKVGDDLSSKKINSSQASALQNDIATNQTGLNTLKTKLDAETKAPDARKDVANVYLQFRIYAVVLPRDARTLEYDIESNVQATMQAAIPTIQTSINGDSKDKDKLTALFNDYQKQVSAAGSLLSPLPNDFSAMTPTAFNQTRSAYETTRTTVDNSEKSARADLHQAAKDLKQITALVGKSK